MKGSSLIIALLQEAGEIADSQGHAEPARESRLKALHLLLEVTADQRAGEHFTGFCAGCGRAGQFPG